MPHHTEPQLNGELARVLRKKHPAWNEDTVIAENTRTIKGNSSLQPDIIVALPNCRPICVEAEVEPANTVEEDAVGRLGKQLAQNGDHIECAISVVYPRDLLTSSLDKVGESELEFAVHNFIPEDDPLRWPKRKFIKGGATGLASAIVHSAISESMLARSSNLLNEIITEAEEILSGLAPEHVQSALGDALHQEAGKQTNRMACAILASAMVFHIAIEDQKDIPAVLPHIKITKSRLLSSWEKILKINYYPIFHIAKKIITEIPVLVVGKLMPHISEAVEEIVQIGTSSYQGLCGRMFQNLIVDRKLLATFYTLPTSASLLAEIALNRLKTDWANQEEIESLRIGDFACGTGALLSAAQSSIYDRFRLNGGDDKMLHRFVMEKVLTGLDIMPAATHLSSATLSSAHPKIPYQESQIITMPFGTRKTEDQGTSIGSLDFLKGSVQGYLFGGGIEAVQANWGKNKQYNLPVDTFNLVIMNPPFTRNVGQEGKKIGIPRPAFAAFKTSKEEQAAMAKELSKYNSLAGHGGAGPASNFIDLADTRTKPNGGVIALVLPFTFTCGASWRKARNLLKKKYQDVHILAIAHEKMEMRSFSASTGIAECLVIATKRSEREIQNIKAFFTKEQTLEKSHEITVTTLKERPASICEAVVMARTKNGGG